MPKIKSQMFFEKNVISLKRFVSKGVSEYHCDGITQRVAEFYDKKTEMEFVLIPGGIFQMGSKFGNEKPAHNKRVFPFLITKYLCTQKQWVKTMKNNPSFFRGDNYPVEMVTWDQCKEFCRRTELRLPSEIQWEYACRGASKGEYYFGDKSKLGEYAWYFDNSGGQTHPVGKKKPNAYGLYDLHGNVFEFCSDQYKKYGPQKDTVERLDPKPYQCVRGGSWAHLSERCRTARRCFTPHDRFDSVIGVRFVCSILMLNY